MFVGIIGSVTVETAERLVVTAQIFVFYLLMFEEMVSLQNLLNFNV